MGCAGAGLGNLVTTTMRVGKQAVAPFHEINIVNGSPT